MKLEQRPVKWGDKSQLEAVFRLSDHLDNFSMT